MNYQDLKKIGNLSLVASLITILALNVEPARAGVFPASGDTTDTTSVLWGRSTEPGPLQFEYGTDPTFANLQGAIVGNVVDPYLPVKVPVSALAGGNTYYYRVTNAVGETATGRFQTPAPLGERPGLRFGVSGDWRGELAPYPAIRNAASRDLNFFVKLGDTIYADYPSPAVPASQATTLEEFRQKHAEVYSERYGLNTWNDLRSVTSVLSMIDDHEVINDFQGGAPASSDPRFNTNTGSINETPLYRAGLQAFQEYNPLEDRFYGATGDPRTENKRKLYRYQTYGSDAALFLLDARSFRDEGLAPVTDPNNQSQVATFLTNSFDPSRTLLGKVQLEEVKRDLLDAQRKGVLWKFIFVPEPIQNLGTLGASDRFEGYAAERTALLDFITKNNIQNVVFVTADIHGTLVNNLTYQTAPFTAQIPASTWEISTGSVAFDAPFGPTVIDLATATGLLTPAQVAFYNSLPRAGKDGFIRSLVNSGITPLGYDPLGLENSGIPATLLQGSYLSTHTYGWTEFEIQPTTGRLSVTTYGIDPYSEAELNADPNRIVSRAPSIVSQFDVDPRTTPEPGSVSGLLALSFLGIVWRERERARTSATPRD